MRNVHHSAIEDGFLDLLGQDTANFEEVKLTDVASSVVQLAAMYAGLIREKLDAVDAASSGSLADSIKPTELEYNGTTYTIGIEAKSYLDYVDKGVNGWAVNRGSVYSFKTKGVNPEGDMVKSVKEWLSREGASARNIKQGVSSRENKGMSADTRNAVTAAYMIKRQGIQPKKFMQSATNEMEVVIKSELGTALRIDIINNFTK